MAVSFKPPSDSVLHPETRRVVGHLALQTGDPRPHLHQRPRAVERVVCVFCRRCLTEELLRLSLQRQVPLFSQDGSRFFLTLPVKQGGQGDFHHLTMISRKVTPRHVRPPPPPSVRPPSGPSVSDPSLCSSPQPRSDQDEVQHLTSGDWEVTEVLAYDEISHLV